ncbi:hypothetical protein like AT3G22550 [Hibiscus trionum]|uniref:FLZ-type domain-containing protein n=1 Tax=Hibiscus trionum TaxID=183268 RepID=A0A9W7HB46_HIBTR|nr:hypothetical protein like AT3G22550 [Hibiscus trionum]
MFLSRAVARKQALMADHSSQSTRPTPFLFGSPKFKAFTAKCLPESESAKTPTSILDSKPLFPLGNHFCFHPNQPKSPKSSISPETLEPKGVGLAIVENQTSNTKVLFGTKLRVCPNSSPRGCTPIAEMELSEDYTCVKSHGANPKTTHIYDNCVVRSSYFLSFCHTCKKDLEQKIDIYIYRGEKAFCSQEMILHGEEN